MVAVRLMVKRVLVVIVVGGVPLSTPVLAFKVAHEGSPVALNVGAGLPVAVMVKLSDCPMVKVVAFELVMAGS